MKYVLIIVAFVSIVGCKRFTDCVGGDCFPKPHPEELESCEVSRQSPLDTAEFRKVYDGTGAVDSLYIVKAWGNNYADSTAYSFTYLDSTKVHVEGLLVMHHRDGRPPQSWDSSYWNYDVTLNDSGYATTIVHADFAEYPTHIEYENGRVKQIWSEYGASHGNFEYDARGNLVRLIADNNYCTLQQ